MTTQQLTPWFDGTIKPERAGVYERNYGVDEGLFYCYWNGTWWSHAAMTPHHAVESLHCNSLNQRLPWRGLMDGSV